MKAAEQKASRVSLGIATDNENVFTLFDKAGGQVLGRGRFTDAAFTIDSDLT